MWRRCSENEAERSNSYRRPGKDPLWDLVVEVIGHPALPVKETAAGARVSTDTVERARAGRLTGKTRRAAEARKELTRYAVNHASARLRKAGITDNPRKTSPQALLARYLEQTRANAAERRCARAGCGRPARPRSDYCTDRCARAAWQAAYRKRKARTSPRAQRRSDRAGRSQ